MAACLTPFIKQNPITHELQSFPCGKCPECLARRVSGWSFRLMQEDKVSTSSVWITLTYGTSHVPITGNGFMDLRKRDVQLFFKRLRKSQDANYPDHPRIKYYLVGEYGTQRMRPHYHALLFNAKLPLISPAWELGDVYYGTVSGASVGYTLKYMCKPSRIPLHRNDDRQKEFALMSKGLGDSYLSNEMVRWHHADPNNRMYVNIDDGKKIAMPRYFKNKIYVESERKIIGYFARQKMVADQLKIIAKHGPDCYKDKIPNDLGAFERMYKNSTVGRNKL